MLRKIDHTDTHTIQKVSHADKRAPNGMRVHFQTIETALIGKGGVAVEHPTLKAAREAVGKVLTPPVVETAPARSYAEQNKGYARK